MIWHSASKECVATGAHASEKQNEWSQATSAEENNLLLGGRWFLISKQANDLLAEANCTALFMLAILAIVLLYSMLLYAIERNFGAMNSRFSVRAASAHHKC